MMITRYIFNDGCAMYHSFNSDRVESVVIQLCDVDERQLLFLEERFILHQVEPLEHLSHPLVQSSDVLRPVEVLPVSVTSHHSDSLAPLVTVFHLQVDFPDKDNFRLLYHLID